MNDMNVARRYAWALFQLADERKVLEQVFADLRSLRSILKDSTDFKIFILNPVVSKEEQISLLRSVFEGRLQELAMTFLYFLVDKMRLNILCEILESFIDLYWESTNTITATISTERTMDPVLLQKLVSMLQERSKKNVMAETVIDPQLLGGFKVRMGDQVYDASVAAQLNRYHEDVLSIV